MGAATLVAGPGRTTGAKVLRLPRARTTFASATTGAANRAGAVGSANIGWPPPLWIGLPLGAWVFGRGTVGVAPVPRFSVRA